MIYLDAEVNDVCDDVIIYVVIEWLSQIYAMFAIVSNSVSIDSGVGHIITDGTVIVVNNIIIFYSIIIRSYIYAWIIFGKTVWSTICKSETTNIHPRWRNVYYIPKSITINRSCLLIFSNEIYRFIYYYILKIGWLIIKDKNSVSIAGIINCILNLGIVFWSCSSNV